MTQGYGPDHGQQPQWGQNGQNPPPAPQPQWGQPAPQSSSPAAAPQWGQTSPAPATGSYPGSSGYPGASGAPQFVSGDGVNWSRVRLVGLILLIAVALLLLIRLGISLAALVMAPELATDPAMSDPGALAIGSSLVTLLLAGANLVVSLAVIGLGIAAAVMGRGKARVGGIVIAATVVISVVLYWIMAFVVALILVAAGMVDPYTGALSVGGYRLNSVLEAVRQLVMLAIMGVSAYLVFTTAKKNLSA